ncbi:MAG: Ig-like domain-containing protein [Planctomycetota bacterium]
MRSLDHDHSSATRRGRGLGPRWVALGVLCGATAACWQERDVPPPSPFTVARVYPALGPSQLPLLLNDAITVYFTEPVDPMTVTRDSVAVLDREGHPVRGTLRVDASWVTFQPEPPLLPELSDGSLQPDTEYRLSIAGYPRVDGVRSADGRLLDGGAQVPFRTAPRDVTALGLGLPAPLRPAPDERPFLLRPPETGTVPLPADDPRVQLHFTTPILPGSVTPAAFEISLARGGVGAGIEVIEPRAVRLLPRMPVDELPGSTVEIEFGAEVRVRGSDRTLTLQPDDFVGVQLVLGDASLRDYAGRQPPIQVQWCEVIAGMAVTVAEWPDLDEAGRAFDAGAELPGFEVTEAGDIRPLVRLEAGDGHLGAFRPMRDTVLVPGQPFDRGDGAQVAAPDGVFAFTAIDVPAGVTVRIDASAGPVLLQAMGRIRVTGRIEVLGAAPNWAPRPGQVVDVSVLRAGVAVVLLAAGGIDLRGAVTAPALAGGNGAPLALVTAGELTLSGVVPPGTVLATERGNSLAAPAADRCVAVRVRLEPGVPPGTEVLCSAYTPFRALPADRGAASARIERTDPALRVAWQTLPPDPRRRDLPDLDPARAAPARELVDGQRIDAAPGAFVRLRCEARVHGGVALPRLLRVRLLDR